MFPEAHWRLKLPHTTAAATGTRGLRRVFSPALQGQIDSYRTRRASSYESATPGSDFQSLVRAYWIFTAKMITADCPGVRVPTVALMVPAVPFAGAVIVPTVVLAAGLLLYTVKAGVASLTTTLVTLAVPALVAVIR